MVIVWALAILLNADAGASPTSASSADVAARKLVADLLRPERRDRAVCRLIGLGRYRGHPCEREKPCSTRRVNEVIVASQGLGPPLYAVFLAFPFIPEEDPQRKTSGAFLLFDSDGFMIPIFEAANMLGRDDAVFAYAGWDHLAVAQLLGYGSSGDDAKWTTQVLHIVPMDARQKSVLSVIVGPSTYSFEDTCKGFYWSWRYRDLKGDGFPQIEIGPVTNSKGEISPRATYRWSEASKAYVGPQGSPAEGFQRIDGQRSYVAAAKAFALERKKLAEPGDPTAVRRPGCHSVGPIP